MSEISKEIKEFNDENKQLQNHLHEVYRYDKAGIICGIVMLALFVIFWIFYLTR